MKTNLQPNRHITGQEEKQETTGKIHISQGLVLTGDKAKEFRKMALKVVEGNNEVIKMLDDLEEEKERKLKLSIPNMPDSWKNKKELVDRFNLFVGFIIKNPVWWQEWKTKISLYNDRIVILGTDWTLYTYWDKRQNLGQLGKNDLYLSEDENLCLPSCTDFMNLYKFVYSLGKENFGTLAKFLGLEEFEKVEYWTIDMSNMKIFTDIYKTYSFINGGLIGSASDNTKLHIHQIIVPDIPY